MNIGLESHTNQKRTKKDKAGEGQAGEGEEPPPDVYEPDKPLPDGDTELRRLTLYWIMSCTLLGYAVY